MQVYGTMTDVDSTVRWCGGREAFYALLESKMIDATPRCREQVLYILCNATASATSTTSHKDYIVSLDGLLQQIIVNLHHTDAPVKVAALWCIINLAWAESVGVAHRQQALLKHDILTAVQNLQNDPDLDVKDRAKTTLEQFSSCGNAPPTFS